MSLEGLNQVKSNIVKYGDDMVQKGMDAIERATGDAEAYAKTNAPWTDRTGNARNSIQASGPVMKGRTIVGAVAIGMFYGKYLELSNGGKYRIIKPAVELMSPRVLGYMR